MTVDVSTPTTTSPEGARRAAGGLVVAAPPVGEVQSEVSEKAKRRHFTAEYKAKILREAERCKSPGQVGALLRREGLYSSLLSEWRRQRDQVAKAALKAIRRGPKPRVVDPRIRQLEREKARLERRLAQAEAIIDIQKKVSEILGIPLAKIDVEEID
jgi:transposase-like protein